MGGRVSVSPATESIIDKFVDRTEIAIRLSLFNCASDINTRLYLFNYFKFIYLFYLFVYRREKEIPLV